MRLTPSGIDFRSFSERARAPHWSRTCVFGHVHTGPTLVPGNYLLICNQPNHYKAGMWTKLTSNSMTRPAHG